MSKITELIEAGIIRLGMTKADLRILLGSPDCWGGVTRKYKEPCIWKYDNAEFYWQVKKYRTPYPGPELVGVCFDTDRHDSEHKMLLGK
jgi:hypothetical protein